MLKLPVRVMAADKDEAAVHAGCHLRELLEGWHWHAPPFLKGCWKGFQALTVNYSGCTDLEMCF